jgi:hypothetical protein
MVIWLALLLIILCDNAQSCTKCHTQNNTTIFNRP